MRIDKFMKELETLIFKHGDTCKVMTALVQKQEKASNSNLHPSMSQALAPFIKGLSK